MPAPDPLRKILVTGASRGLGRALAERLASLGHHVAGCARDGEAMRQLAASLGRPHHFRAVDVTDDGGVAAWAEEVTRDFGVPDLVVNNAGLINRRAPLWKVPADEMRRVVEVNILGIVNVLRHFLPPMIARGSGVVCNMSSGWGKFSAPEVGPYCATKFAVEGMTGSLAQELPEGMAAVPLSPGVIHTEMLDVAFGDAAAEHWGTAEWAVTAADFILGIGPEHNGQSLRIPGSAM